MFGSLFQIEKVIATDFKGISHHLKMQNSNGENLWNFIDDSGRITAQINAVDIDEGISFRVKADIKTNISYDQRLTFSETDSIRIFLSPLENDVSVMGSYFELEEKNDAWCGVFWADSLKKLPQRVASVLFKKENCFYHIIPLCDGDFKGEINGCDGMIEITVSPYTGGFSNISAAAFVLGKGNDPYITVEENLQRGFKALGKRRALRRDKRLPQLFNYLGWCSWDGFRTNVNTDGVIEKAKEFNDKKIPLGWILIDDGWYCEDEKKRLLRDFKENENKFPGGIKIMVDRLKNEFNIKWVGAWQCFLGCWCGIDPGGKIAESYSDLILKTNSGAVLPAPDLGKCFEFWNTWNTYLRDQGIDFVKSDVQNSLEAYVHGNMSIGKAARNSHMAMDASVALNFDGGVINCTAMGTESLWNRPSSAVNRNSGDFLCTEPKTMRAFVAKNIYNSVYHSVLYYTDWDMMWTMGPTSKINTVLHAVSGAPVYISDPVGESDASVIIPFADDEGRLLKCDDFAMPAEDVLFKNVFANKVMLKAWNRSFDGGVIGAFNTLLSGGDAVGTISPQDIPLLKGEKFAVYDWYEKEIRILAHNESMEINVEENEARLFLIVPFENDVCVLGLLDKYISTAAVKEKRILNNRTVIILKCGGTFGYICNAAHKVLVNGNEVVPEERSGLKVLNCRAEVGDIFIEIVMC